MGCCVRLSNHVADSQSIKRSRQYPGSCKGRRGVVSKLAASVVQIGLPLLQNFVNVYANSRNPKRFHLHATTVLNYLHGKIANIFHKKELFVEMYLVQSFKIVCFDIVIDLNSSNCNPTATSLHVQAHP